MNKFALLSVVLGLSFPLCLLLLADLSYPASPWVESSPHFLLALVLIPIGAVVSGHIAVSQKQRMARVGLLLGYIGIAALPVVAFFNGSPHESDESSAVASLRTLSVSLKAYADGHQQQGSPRDLRTLHLKFSRTLSRRGGSIRC
jgi:hypothetical protein